MVSIAQVVCGIPLVTSIIIFSKSLTAPNLFLQTAWARQYTTNLPGEMVAADFLQPSPACSTATPISVTDFENTTRGAMRYPTYYFWLWRCKPLRFFWKADEVIKEKIADPPWHMPSASAADLPGRPQMSLTVLKTTGEFDGKIKEIADLLKRQNGLVPGQSPSNSREHTQSVLYLQTVQVIERFMPPRLPAPVYYPRLVYFGDEFVKNKEYRLASAECYARFLNADVQRRTGGGLHADMEEQLALETRATLGLISCDFFMAMEGDPEMRKPHTVETVVRLLSQTRSTMQEVAPNKDLYWLIYNGTVTMFTLCTPMLAFGYHSLVIEFLVFACQSMEAQVPLCQVKYVSWRARLYATVCLAYEEAKMRTEALSFAQRGLQAVRKLNTVEGLDPVPPPAAMKKLLAAAELEMLINVIRYSNAAEMSGAQAMEQLQEVPQLKGQLDKPGALLLLVRAIISCIEDSQRRAIRHVPPEEHEVYKTELLARLSDLIQPKLQVLVLYDCPPPPPPELLEGDPAPQGGADEEAEETPTPVSGQDYEAVARELPYEEMVELLKFAYNFEVVEMFKMLCASCILRLKYESVDCKLKAQVEVLDALYSVEHPTERSEDLDKDPKVGEAVVPGELPHEARVRLKLHSLSRVSQHLTALTQQNVAWEPDSASGPDLFADAALLMWNHAEDLLDTVDASAPEPLQPPPPLPSPRQPPPKRTGKQEACIPEPPLPPGEGAEGEQGEAGESESAEAAPEAGEEGAKADEEDGHAGDKPHTPQESREGRSSAGYTPPPATLRQLATLVLEGVHATFMWVQLDDALLCGTVAVRLSFILEKRNRKEDALLVAEQAMETLNRARSNLVLQDISASEDWKERFALSSLSTNTGNIHVPRRPNEQLEQSLACLHVDVLHARFRIILQLGVDDARREAGGVEAKHALERLQRTKDQALFGAKSRKKVRQEWEQAERDQHRPVLPKAAIERQLLASCNRNLYEKAIVLIEMARLPRKGPERSALLAQAFDALAAAEQDQVRVARQVNEAPSTVRSRLPQAPRLVMRGATEMILMADPWRQAAHAKPPPGSRDGNAPALPEVVGLALFAKEQGSGVAVSLNNVGYRGCGVPRPLGHKILISGLEPNESYVFAVAAFDRHGHVIGGIGETSDAVVAQVALPLMYMFAELSLSAHAMGCREMAQEAAIKVYSALVISGQPRRLWEQSAVSRDVLNLPAITRSPPAMLRLFALLLMQMGEAADAQASQTHVGGLRKSQLSQHTSRLAAAKKLVMAVYVAGGIDDQALACKAAIQLYHLLVPLLSMKVWHASMMQALTVVRLAIRVMFDAHKAGEGQGDASGGGPSMTPQVRRVLSCLSSAVLRCVDEVEEEDLLKHLQHAEFDECLHMTTTHHFVPSAEERSLLQTLLCIPNLRDKASSIEEGNTQMFKEAGVLTLLRGSPEEAQSKIEPDDARALEFTSRVVQQAVVENKQDIAKGWVAEAIQAAKDKRAAVMVSQGGVASKEALPSLAMPEEEVEEERHDKVEEEGDAAQLNDLSIQFLTASEEQRQRWEDNSLARQERASQRQVTREERVAMRREVASARFAAQLLPRVRVQRQRREQRQLVTLQLRWLGVLQLNGALMVYDEVMRSDLTDADKWPEPDTLKPDDPTPGVKEAQEGQEADEGEEPTRVLPTRAMQSTDPAFVALPHVAGSLRAAKLCVKGMARAAVIACRAREWAMMLNACLHLSNMVRDLFSSEQDLAIVAPYMRAVGDCIIDMLVNQAAQLSGAPPPGSSPEAIALHRAPPILSSLVYSAGILHRMNEGNGTSDDTYDATLMSNVLLLCLRSLSSAKRWVAVLTLGCQVHALLDEGCALEEQLIPHMLQACMVVMQATEEKNCVMALYGQLQSELLHLTKETAAGGRLMEGLRARAKEREEVIARIALVEALIKTQHTRLAQLRFIALTTLPGSSIEVATLKGKWEELCEVYARDKSPSLLELLRCRALLAAFAEEQMQPAAVSSSQDAQHDTAKDGGEAEDVGEAEDSAQKDAGEVSEEEAGQLLEEQAAQVATHQQVLHKAAAHALAKRQKQWADKARDIGVQYSVCVHMLREKQQTLLLPWALHEYGQTLWYQGNSHGAAQAWNDSLDCIFTAINVGRHWRDHIDPTLMLNAPVKGVGGSVLEKVGLKSVLGAACIGSKLASYIYTSDLHQQLEYALFVAHLLAAPFTSGLPHPQRARDFANYVPQELVEGEDGFADAFAVDAATLMDGCELCAKVLFANGYGLMMLPMVSLYQWCAKSQCKDPVAYANATVWKARACVSEGLVTEACGMLFDLHSGWALPDVVPLPQRPPEGTQGLAIKETRSFNMLQDPASENNLGVLQAVVDLTVASGLKSLYPPTINHLLVLCRIELLIKVTGAQPMWPHPYEPLAALCVHTESIIDTLRQSLADIAAAQVPVTPVNSEASLRPPPAEGDDVPSPTAAKLNGYTRLALSVVAQCHLYSVRLLQKQGLYTTALLKLDDLMQLLQLHGHGHVGGGDALQAFAEKGSDMRQHTHPLLWLECRRMRTELLFLQARWGQLKQDAARALQDMADFNEQLLARDVMTRLVLCDIHVGQDDLSVSTLEEMIGKALMLHQEDVRLALLLSVLADVHTHKANLSAADAALQHAERVVQECLAARGVPQSNSLYMDEVGVLIKIKMRRAQLALRLPSSHQSSQLLQPLHTCLHLCEEVKLLIAYAPYVTLHTRARFHFYRARARRQLMVQASARLAWGGTFVPNNSSEDVGEEVGECDEASSTGLSDEQTRYSEVLHDLQASLSLTVEAGGFDAQLARSVFLEAALLHGATLVPKHEALHLQRAMHNLKVASEIAGKRKALLAVTGDESSAAVPHLPPFVVAEFAEAAAERARTGIFGAGDDGGGGHESTCAGGVAYYLLANLRELKLMLFDEDHSISRIAKLHKAMVHGVPSYADTCNVTIGPDELTQVLEPEPGMVVAQWYKAMDVHGKTGGGGQSANLLLVLSPENMAAPSGQTALLLCLAVHAPSIGVVAGEAAAAKMSREEAALGPENKVATSQWNADVFPSLGRLKLQGQAAVAAKESTIQHLTYKANVAGMGLMGVALPPLHQPATPHADAPAEPGAQAEEEEAGAEPEAAAEVPPQGPRMLGVDDIHLLFKTLSEQGLSETEAQLCDVLTTWLQDRTQSTQS